MFISWCGRFPIISMMVKNSCVFSHPLRPDLQIVSKIKGIRHKFQSHSYNCFKPLCSSHLSSQAYEKHAWVIVKESLRAENCITEETILVKVTAHENLLVENIGKGLFLFACILNEKCFELCGTALLVVIVTVLLEITLSPIILQLTWEEY